MTRAVRLACWVGLGVLALGVVPAEAEARALSPRSGFRTLVVQHQGRLKPLDSFARETLRQITGAARLGRQDPLDTVLDILRDPEPWRAVPLLHVPFRPLREALGMDPRAARISYQDLVASRRLMRLLPAIVEKEQRSEKLSMLEHETMDAYRRFVALSGLLDGDLPLVPPPAPPQLVWSSIRAPKGYPEPVQRQLRERWADLLVPSAIVDQKADAMAALLHSLNPAAFPPTWRLNVEVGYHQAAPFQWARWFYLLSALGLLAGLWWNRPGLLRAGWWVLLSAFLLHANGMLLRVLLGERPPVSNFYETMLWLPFVAVAVALLVERVLRVRYVHFSAALLAGVTLALADAVPLDASIAPVVAVLRSNFWLTVHVLTIVASYGALALATVLAHSYAVLFLRRRDHAALPAVEAALYRVLQVGVVLLAGGVILGAVWANASWGRYWGWDPKETWALITLLWFLALLHGRLTGWLRGIGMALTTIGGFFLLLMTYYGVSFYLVGLHSYAGGHAKPLPALLIGYLAAELLFLLWVGRAAVSRRPPSA